MKNQYVITSLIMLFPSKLTRHPSSNGFLFLIFVLWGRKQRFMEQKICYKFWNLETCHIYANNNHFLHLKSYFCRKPLLNCVFVIIIYHFLWNQNVLRLLSNGHSVSDIRLHAESDDCKFPSCPTKFQSARSVRSLNIKQRRRNLN